MFLLFCCWQFPNFVVFIQTFIRTKKYPVSGLRARFLRGYETMYDCSHNCWIDWNPAVLYFKRFSPQRGMNVCLICESSLSHHALKMGNLIPAYTCITYFPVTKTPKSASPHRKFEADLWRMTHDPIFGLIVVGSSVYQDKHAQVNLWQDQRSQAYGNVFIWGARPLLLEK